jgi:hypothetical protein
MQMFGKAQSFQFFLVLNISHTELQLSSQHNSINEPPVRTDVCEMINIHFNQRPNENNASVY